MKKILIYSTCAVLTLSGCYSGTGQGAYAGASLGSIIGSAIGGISGGHRGSDMGTLIGMAGGAIVGAAVGNASDKAANAEYQRHKEQIYGDSDDTSNRRPERRSAYTSDSQTDESGFDPNNGGDDRIEFDATPAPGTTGQDENTFHVGTAPKSTVPVQEVSLHDLANLQPTYNIKYNSLIEVRNATFVDDSGDGILYGGEQGKVTFEIMNNSSEVLRDVVPTVIETTGNKRIHISPSIRVESIAPHQGIRYTAIVQADKRLKDGSISIKVAVAQNGNEITSQVKEFDVPTKRK